jgi:hypothetical protein
MKLKIGNHKIIEVLDDREFEDLILHKIFEVKYYSRAMSGFLFAEDNFRTCRDVQEMIIDVARKNF